MEVQSPIDNRQSAIFSVFSFPVLLGCLLVAGVFFGSQLSFVEEDTWWHLQVGADILRTHTWPTTDSYSFTVHGNEWIAYEWLGEVVMALAYRLWGLAGLMLLLIVLGSILALLLYYYAYLRCGNAKAAFVAVTPLLLFVIGFLRLRPQLLGYIFLLLMLICLERFRQGRRRALWVLPGVFLLWVNTHPTFMLGLLILAAAWASGLVRLRWGGLESERWTLPQRLQVETVFLICVVVLPLTPYGGRLVGYFLEAALFQPLNVASIQEWQPAGAFPGLLKLLLAFVLLFLLAQIVLRPSYRLLEMALFLLAFYLTFVHVRFVLLFAVALAPLLAELLSRWVPNYQAAKDRHLLNAVLILLLAFGLVKAFPSQKELEGLVASRVPGAVVEYVRRHPLPGPMLNEYNWGGYLLRSLGPTHKVFIDGRTDAYEPAGVLSDYLDIAGLRPDARLLLRKYGIEAYLIGSRSALATLLAALPEWERIYQDQRSVIFVRRKTLERASYRPGRGQF